MLQAEERKAGVLGWPIGHSLSPRLHNYWLKQYDIKGSYEALAVSPENLETTLRALPSQGFCGVNITIPHKEKTLAFIDEADGNARRIGAVNTIIVKEEKLIGFNTDAYGFTANFKAQIPHYQAANALVLGTGGAARAVIDGLIRERWDVTIATRSREKSEAMISLYRQKSGYSKEIKIIPWEEIPKGMSHCALLVNTTPLGMKNHEPLNFSLETLSPTAIVYDIVYNPRMTPLLEEAKARGNPIVTGLGMLLYQAQLAFALWFGLNPAVTPELYRYMEDGL